MSEPVTAETPSGRPEGQPLLAPDEPAAYQVVNPGGRAPVILLCDHASRFIPRALGTLGLNEAELKRHIAWDIGVAEVTKGLAERLDAPAVLSGFSRLIIDPNRTLDDPTLIPQLSDGVVVPGNRALPPAAVQARVEEFHRCYHAAIAEQLDRLCHGHEAPAVVSMHSFTPVMKGVERPWQIGVLWNEDTRLADPLMARLRAQGIPVGSNEPYSARDAHGYTLFVHALPRRLSNVLIEVRQDLIDTHHGAAEWTDRLSDALRAVLESVGVLSAKRPV